MIDEPYGQLRASQMELQMYALHALAVYTHRRADRRVGVGRLRRGIGHALVALAMLLLRQPVKLAPPDGTTPSR